MADYREMYLTMAWETEKAVRVMEEALKILIAAQQKSEEIYINSPEPVIELLERNPKPQEDMFYTEYEERRIKNILKAFEGFIKGQDYFDIIYWNKVGYVELVTKIDEVIPTKVLKTVEDVMDTLCNGVIREVTYIYYNKKWSSSDMPPLSVYVETESRRILTEIVGTMEEERDFWMEYVDQYLKDYRENFTDG